MKITLNELFLWQQELPIIIHSIDRVGYQATVTIDDQSCLIVNADGKPLCHKSLMKMREALQAMPVSSLSLSHQSAYDEMINQPLRQGDNTLQLPLSMELYPYASEQYYP
ncbi:DUF6482 family protein [Oceanicoccus sagamiensis]|uniref:Uncharacterized protein n=1 Tax=Oceanicoccus sagamiensis TaxID=716816 RepID=A0A1X9NGG2_9GAMM|nr:DUF6482 family protein [Oceanicoccus sagamiensis]ARN75482.1 hypothetical protein BST96_16010 [Oceanicoccus sagamiensis]